MGNQAWWHTPIIPALRKLRQEYCEFEARQGYMVRPVSKNKKRLRETKILTK
jgi:hypothetical protein